MTYYVDFTAGSDSNSGITTSNPWKHCPGDSNGAQNAGSATLAPGDTVVFKGGISYMGQITCAWSGSSGVPITYRSGHLTDPKWGTTYAAFDGNNYTRRVGFNLNGKHFITFDGLEITKSDYTGTGSQGVIHSSESVSDLIIQNCKIHDNDTKALFLGSGGTNITISNCEIAWHDNSSEGGGHKALFIAPSSSRVLIQRCYIHHNGVGIHLHGSTTPIIRYCHFFEQSLPVAEHHEDHFQIADTTDVLVYNNFFECPGEIRPDGLCDQGLSFTYGAAKMGTTGEVFGNVITGRNGAQIALRNNTSNMPHTYIKIYNNSFFSDASRGSIVMRNPWEQCTAEVYNNSFYTTNCSHRFIIKLAGNGFIGDNNYYFCSNGNASFNYEGSWMGFGAWKNQDDIDDSESVEADPKHDNLVDLTPQADSPLINSGIDLGSTYNTGLAYKTAWDWANSDKPETVKRLGVNNAWDIGAYEYDFGIAAPQNLRIVEVVQ
jgi:hypothetical protein